MCSSGLKSSKEERCSRLRCMLCGHEVGSSVTSPTGWKASTQLGVRGGCVDVASVDVDVGRDEVEDKEKGKEVA